MALVISDALKQTNDPFSITYESFPCLTIGQSLARLCRYAGRGDFFLSVAQHSALLSRVVPDEYRFAALMHDISEAFIGDIPGPFKRKFPELEQAEEQIQEHIFGLFDIPFWHLDAIHEYDVRIRYDEMLALGLATGDTDQKLGVYVRRVTEQEAADAWVTEFLSCHARAQRRKRATRRDAILDQITL